MLFLRSFLIMVVAVVMFITSEKFFELLANITCVIVTVVCIILAFVPFSFALLCAKILLFTSSESDKSWKHALKIVEEMMCSFQEADKERVE